MGNDEDGLGTIRTLTELSEGQRAKAAWPLRLPAPGESAAVSFESPKTTALCFDRVWSLTGGHKVPSEVAFNGHTALEMDLGERYIGMFGALSRVLEQEIESGSIDLSELPAHERDALRDRRAFDLAKKLAAETDENAMDALASAFVRFLEGTAQMMPPGTRPGGVRAAMARSVVEALNSAYQLDVVPIYSSEAAMGREYAEGQHGVVVAAMRNLAVVDEKSLDWEQVVEFRRDREMRDKYRRLVHWLDMDMIGRSAAFIEDTIALKLDDYRAAMQKHGIRTKLGLLSTFHDAEKLAATAAVATGGFLAAGPMAAAGAGVALVISQVAVQIAQRRIDLDEAKSHSPGAEVAFLFEAQRATEDKKAKRRARPVKPRDQRRNKR